MDESQNLVAEGLCTADQIKLVMQWCMGVVQVEATKSTSPLSFEVSGTLEEEDIFLDWCDDRMDQVLGPDQGQGGAQGGVVNQASVMNALGCSLGQPLGPYLQINQGGGQPQLQQQQ